MKRFLLYAALTLLLGAAVAPAVRAQVEIRVPFVYVRVGQPTIIRAPFVRLVFPGCAYPARAVPKSAVLMRGDPPPVPVQEVPSRIVPSIQTVAAPPVKAAQSVMTVKEFAASFKALPSGGKYEVMLQHTFTGKPVKVSFTLPPGMPKKVTAGKLRLEFRYGRGRPVVVRFYRNGNVQVLRG
jgi:hypothetical protein